MVGIVKGTGRWADGTPAGYGAVHVFTVRDDKIVAFREFTDLGTPIA